ncbi:hypothetical protein FJV76_30700 [Mesorhizobium sp. WSM4303]|uniref:hypothetical protein n=1 Tax=unclassified Mesorhizobium TaxID=325217 RepID=UPI00115DB20C|nr:MULTISPECIES: hypothetical protein [unclassified Mesorhizobium]TRC86999.1 hypothetical protein FJV77_30970 [Mesorhizobium sp. WSM4306]TRC94384.1 hypothetical protein FJV76_30700 [Mesorhizobium sp. WSM4303]
MLEGARSRLKAWIVTGIGTAAAIAVAGVLGAFEAGHAQVPVLARAGPIETGQWLLQPVKAYVSAEKYVYGTLRKPGTKALVFEVDMTNRTAQSTKDYFDLVQATRPPLDPATKPYIVLTRDSTLSPELHPGMTERMAYVWELPEGGAVPASLGLTVMSKIYKQRDNLYGLPGWFNPSPVGTLTIPVAPDTGGQP